MKVKIIVIGGLLSALTLTWMAINALNFFLMGSSPRGGDQKVSIHNPVVLTFNKSIHQESVKNFKISPHAAGSIKLEGNKLTFTPREGFKLNQEYDVSWTAPKAMDGRISKDVKFSFRTAYINFNDLPEDQQEMLVKRTDQIEVEHPIVGKLPHETLHYLINYELSKEGELTLLIKLYATQNRPDQYDEYRSQTKEYQQEALDFLKENGVDPNDYPIKYTPDPDKL